MNNRFIDTQPRRDAMSNPLLDENELPPFKDITPECVLPAIQTIIEENQKNIATLLENAGSVSWETLQQPLDTWNDRLSQAWSPVGHLNSVVNSDELREAYNQCLPLLSEYSTALGQNEKLFKAVSELRSNDSAASLTEAQIKAIDNQLRDFRLSGIDLPEEQKQRFSEIKKRLSELGSKFSEHVLDATHAWYLHVEDASDLKGVPETALESAKSAAREKELEGFVFTLDIPSYLPIATYCENRDVREQMYKAYCTRASNEGPNAGEFDNSDIIKETLALRHEIAQLLGFENYAERSLATKMAKDPEEVMKFLTDLVAKSKQQGEIELKELKEFAAQELGIDQLEVWDVTFASEKLKQQRYSVSQEELRPYFPAPKVISGMFEVVQRLFSISFKQQSDIALWHPDVTFYEVLDDQGKKIGAFYLDLYARAKKRGGAWMDECRVRRATAQGDLQLPVAYLTCNFTPPVDGKPSLLTHNEVTTLFHEFGHGLHHMLTKIDVAAVSGINGVAWDAVELPSQFLENWCWDKEALALISGHHETGETLPEELLNKMLAAKNFQSAMGMLRQLEFSIFDMRIHMEDGKDVDVQKTLNQVRDEVSVFPPPAFNRFQHSFGHIFAGGYAAGYYSYKWAEVLSADAFSKFEEDGIFNSETGQQFKTCILERGGSKEPEELFKAFRGREPSVDALLRHSGIA